MITDIYLVPHSHTDVGYTHPQPVVLELHRRFLEEAMDLAEATAERTDGSAFRWMVEVTGTAIDWWRGAGSAARDRFVAAAQAGRIEVAAMRWNQAQLADHHMLIEAMAPVRDLRAAGVPIRVAMNTDVNGLNWGLVDVLGDFGIEALTMAINEHFGHAVQPRPQAFRWLSPSGRSILVYNGLMYGSTVAGWLGIPVDLEATRAAVPRLVGLLEARGYPHSVLIMQATNVHYHDNAAPNPALPDHVRAFNAEGGPVRLRIATMSEALDRLGNDGLGGIPELRGDWPDWWTFGSGSTLCETQVALAGQRALRDARQLGAWAPGRAPRAADLERQAAEALALYVEHTYTADRAARRPDSRETDSQIHWKKARAYEGHALARMLRRDGLAALAPMAAGGEPGLLAYNPLPFPVRRAIRVPDPAVMAPVLNPAISASSHAAQRQDVELSDYPDEAARLIEVDLPAMGYAVMPGYSALVAPSGSIDVSDGGLGNDRLRLRFDATGAVVSLRCDGTERVDAAWDFGFGVPVLEAPDPPLRATIYSAPAFTDFERAFDLHAHWRTDWVARREAARLVETRVRRGDGVGEVAKVFAFSNGETATVRYRLSAGEPALAIEVRLEKARIVAPHAHYLPMPLALAGAWSSHYETAGAIVELDREQLPGASRHFVTTQRFIRLQGEGAGLTVASPDLPLFQVGGFTFGRHVRGEVRRAAPVLLAWLDNNYWDVNFEVTQSGPLTTRLHVLPHPAESVGASIRRALPYVVEPQLHVLRGGEARRASLFEISAGDLLVTDVERAGNAVRLHLLNPGDRPATLSLGPGHLRPVAAFRTGLDGTRQGPVAVDTAGTLSMTVAGRAWVALELEVDQQQVRSGLPR